MLPLLVAAVLLILGIVSLVIMSAVLVLSSIFGYLTSITNFISSNYFGLAYTTSDNIVWFPELNYISGFVIGASLLSFYIYLTYYNAKNPEDINQKYSFFGSIFAGAGLMAMGRIVYFYGGKEVADVIQTGLIDIINAFPIVISIILFQKTARESSGPSFREIAKTSLEKQEKKRIRKQIAENNLFVKFFLGFLLNPLYISVGIVFIALSAYSTFLIEYYITQIIDVSWAYYVLVLLASSYILSAYRGRKMLE